MDVLVPVLDDLTWSGRAYWVEGRIKAKEKRLDEAILDLNRALRSADSVWVRGQCYLELADIYTSQEQFDKARDCYASYLRFSPPATERLGVLFSIVHSLVRARRFVEAAQMAMDAEMEVTDSVANRFAPGEATRAKTELDPVIAQCETALAVAEAAPKEWKPK